jgi:hypothetical protein
MRRKMWPDHYDLSNNLTAQIITRLTHSAIPGSGMAELAYKLNSLVAATFMWKTFQHRLKLSRCRIN